MIMHILCCKYVYCKYCMNETLINQCADDKYDHMLLLWILMKQPYMGAAIKLLSVCLCLFDWLVLRHLSRLARLYHGVWSLTRVAGLISTRLVTPQATDCFLTCISCDAQLNQAYSSSNHHGESRSRSVGLVHRITSPVLVSSTKYNA